MTAADRSAAHRPSIQRVDVLDADFLTAAARVVQDEAVPVPDKDGDRPAGVLFAQGRLGGGMTILGRYADAW
ncbi:hypothetical protein [Shinella sp. M31]|uniref:hypothetical protein n=1 Tax=Shinella sp. M31 TaxID=3368615 RepID=UPI003BA1E7B7